MILRDGEKRLANLVIKEVRRAIKDGSASVTIQVDPFVDGSGASVFVSHNEIGKCHNVYGSMPRRKARLRR